MTRSATTARTYRLAAALAAVVCLAVLLAAPATPAAAADAAPRTITVTGTGSVEAKPDTARVGVSAVAQRDTASQAMSAVADQTRAILKALSGHGIADKDIQTGSVSLQPIYSRIRSGSAGSNEPPRIVAYRASIQNRVVVRRLDDLGPLLDAVTKAGAGTIGGIGFYVDKTEALQDEARAKAVAEGIRVAHLLAAKAGATLGPVLRIEEAGGMGGPRPQLMRGLAKAAESVPVMPGEVTIDASVNMVFALK